MRYYYSRFLLVVYTLAGSALYANVESKPQKALPQDVAAAAKLEVSPDATAADAPGTLHSVPSNRQVITRPHPSTALSSKPAEPGKTSALGKPAESSKPAVSGKMPAPISKLIVDRQAVNKPTAQTKSRGNISGAYIDEAIREAASKVGVPYLLLKGICGAESGLNPKAYAFNDGGDGNHSIGLCQVLRETGDKIVGADPGCKRDFRTGRGLERSYQNCKLFGPKINAMAAAHYLKSQLKRYKGDVSQAIAAYNTGSLKTCGNTGQVKSRGGKYLYSCIPGDLLNRRYVERVDSFIRRFSLADADSCSRRSQ